MRIENRSSKNARNMEKLKIFFFLKQKIYSMCVKKKKEVETIPNIAIFLPENNLV